MESLKINFFTNQILKLFSWILFLQYWGDILIIDNFASPHTRTHEYGTSIVLKFGKKPWTPPASMGREGGVDLGWCYLSAN